MIEKGKLLSSFLALILLADCVLTYNGFGMTFGKIPTRFAYNGLEFVGCALAPNQRVDRPYVVKNDTLCNYLDGDTSCLKYLPVLCVLKLNIPWSFKTINQISEFQWSGAYFSLSTPVLGKSLRTPDIMRAVCETQFGSGWEPYAYEFTDSNFKYQSGFGNLRDDTRFWVASSRQRSNCWDA